MTQTIPNPNMMVSNITGRLPMTANTFIISAHILFSMCSLLFEFFRPFAATPHKKNKLALFWFRTFENAIVLVSTKLLISIRHYAAQFEGSYWKLRVSSSVSSAFRTRRFLLELSMTKLNKSPLSQKFVYYFE